MELTQEQYILDIDIPIENNPFILTHFSGYEALSAPYHYQLTLLSPDNSIQAKQLLGQSISCLITKNSKQQIFSGIVNHFKKGTVNLKGLFQYQVTIVPFIVALELIFDCQIFYKKSIPEIFISYCKKIGFVDVDISGLQKVYLPLESCAQYNESAFSFLSRLLCQAGIFYYFKQEKNKHTIFLADNLNSLTQFQDIIFQNLKSTRRLNPFQQTISSYNFLSGDLIHSQTLINQAGYDVAAKAKNFEIYCPPAATTETPDQLAMLNCQWQSSTACHWEKHNGQIDDPVLRVGCRCNEYIILECYFEAQDFRSANVEKSLPFFQCNFVASTVGFTLPNNSNTDVIGGVQSAVVIGPEEKKINTDNYGRTKIRFHWEKYLENDSDISWTRSSQFSAGDQFGVQFIPRVGNEVLMHFINDDINTSFITGILPNSSQLPIFNLPSDENKSWIKTHTLNNKNDTGNLLIFDDTSNQEKFVLNAKKNLTTIINNKNNYCVGGNDQLAIGKNQITQVISDGIIYRAETIYLEGGGSRIILNNNGIALNGSANSGGIINLLTKNAGDYKSIARVGDNHQCNQTSDDQTHEGGFILEGAITTKANNNSIARLGDHAYCKAEKVTIDDGISTLIIDGKAAARVNHKTKHGGEITSGSENVFVGERPISQSEG